MLAEVIRFEEDATLIMRTGVQFMDFGLTLDLKKEVPGQFARIEGSPALVRLEDDPVRGGTVHPATRVLTTPVEVLETGVADTLKLLSDVWLPVPFLLRQGGSFVRGPANWARARIVPLQPGEDRDGHTHRVVLAFDTTVYDTEVAGAAYLTPSLKDVESGARFELAWRGQDAAWFCEQKWVADWLRQQVAEAETRARLDVDDIAENARQHKYLAHYLNMLWLLGGKAAPPRIRLLSNRPDDIHRPIPVDMVLDVGNSRTFGILIEDHPQQGDGLKTRYELELRDLTRPHFVHKEPFESRLEFAEATFGKVEQSVQSGRADAFVWPTIARVGPEAARLAARRRGTEGSTGLSSPKRYLWDEAPYQPGWRFNIAFNKAESEPLATATPFGDLINDEGVALHTLPPEEQLQVFVPHYSRSSLMTFMLAEVLVQALCQMNSPGQRMKMSHANLPRQLRTVILTVPPSMPTTERQIFEDRLRQAVGLVWKALGWHPDVCPMETQEDRDKAWPRLPGMRIQWDEATCAQVVYLYSECANNFGGRPEDFFKVLRRPRGGAVADDRRVRVASIDIGGGTTDLVINDYTLDNGSGGNVYILPEQVFRDGFKVAGDDIVHDTIQKLIVPALEQALTGFGVADPASLLSRLIGAEAGIVQDMVLRQQLALQVLYPAGLTLLKEYEQFQPRQGAEPRTETLGTLLAGRDQPSPEVLEYFAAGVRRVIGPGREAFDLLSVPVSVDMNRLHRLFITDQMEIVKPIKALCEIAYLHDCDVLLISGRPSRLPGVQSLFRGLLALPPERVVPLHNYRTGVWYPFHHNGHIADPKTTAAVGAMLCVLGQGRIPNFFFRANTFKLYSTVRYIGLMDHAQTIKTEDVYYADLTLDNPETPFPEETVFEVRGRMNLGFRQLSSPRWGASPLYLIEFNTNNQKARATLYGDKPVQDEDTDGPMVLEVTLRRVFKKGIDRLEIKQISSRGGSTMARDTLTMRLCTLLTRGVGETSHWLDSGTIVR